MENFTLELPWSVIAVILFIVLILYLIVARVFYFLVVLVAGWIKRISKNSIDAGQHIFQLAIPILVSAFVIYWTFIQLSVQFGDGPRSQNFWLGIISTAYFKYVAFFTGYHHDFRDFIMGSLSYTVSMTCLLLTRYSYTKDFIVLGRLKNRRTGWNFIIWTTLIFLISIFEELFFEYFFFRYGPVNILINLGITFLFLKSRNTNKPIQEQW